MKLLLLGLAIAALVLLYSGVTIYKGILAARKLIDVAEPFQKTGDASRAMLVLGDSTAVGVGAARAEESVPGRVAAFIDASSVENYAQSGARAFALADQRAKAKLDRYELILIQIGGNDVVRFNSVEKVSDELERVVRALPPANRVVILTAGDVGDTDVLPFFLNPLYSRLTKTYNSALQERSNALGITYVNLYEDPSRQKFRNDHATYLAADRFHPSSAGYGLWFEAVRKKLSHSL